MCVCVCVLVCAHLEAPDAFGLAEGRDEVAGAVAAEAVAVDAQRVQAGQPAERRAQRLQRSTAQHIEPSAETDWDEYSRRQGLVRDHYGGTESGSERGRQRGQTTARKRARPRAHAYLHAFVGDG